MTLDLSTLDLSAIDSEQLAFLGGWLQAGLLVLVGFFAATVSSRVLARILREGSWGAQHALLVRRFVFWGLLALFGASALNAVGFDLSVLLGAAGIVTVAVGFASQTSASNVISGIFLLAERPFAVGDIIRLGSTTGTVLSIDLLSVKLRTFDNLFVRIPNESVMKSEIVNVSRFPVRRFDLVVRFAPDQSMDDVRQRLLEAADRCPVSLDEPRPVVIFLGYVESGVELQLSAWAFRDEYLDLRNALPLDVDHVLRAAGIQVGFPRRAVALQPVPPETSSSGDSP